MWWLIFVGLATVASSVEQPYFHFSDAVILALLGTGTLNVLAPAVILAKYLFPSRVPNRPEDE